MSDAARGGPTMSTPTDEEARELSARWVLHRSLAPEDALSIGRAALLRRHGIDCLTVCDLHPRARLVALQARGLMTSTMCQPCDGDGWSTGEDEVEGWEITQLGTPMSEHEYERLFAWVLGYAKGGQRWTSCDLAAALGITADEADALRDAAATPRGVGR